MADRGFTIAEDLFARRVKLNISPFLKGKPQFSEEDTIITRRVASVRIHVERAIQRIKSFRIFERTIPSSFLDILDDMLLICATLCNFRGPLNKNTMTTNVSLWNEFYVDLAPFTGDVIIAFFFVKFVNVGLSM